MDLPKLQLKLRLVKTVGREEQRTISISNMSENIQHCGNLTLLIPFQYPVLLLQVAPFNHPQSSTVIHFLLTKLYVP